jgi:hypothetical protein
MHSVAGTGNGAEQIELARDIGSSLDNPVLDGYLEYAAGNVAAGRGDRATAVAHFEAMARLGDQTGSAFLRGIAAQSIALVASALTDPRAAIDAYRSAVITLHDAFRWIELWPAIESLAGW